MSESKTLDLPEIREDHARLEAFVRERGRNATLVIELHYNQGKYSGAHVGYRGRVDSRQDQPYPPGL